MNSFLLLLFIILMPTLIILFISDSINKSNEKPNQTIPLNGLLISAILVTLVSKGIISSKESKDLEGASLEELEEFLINEKDFESIEDVSDLLELDAEEIGIDLPNSSDMP